MLRQEVYALDGTEQGSRIPTSVTEQNFTIRVLQPQGGNRHAVFFTHAARSDQLSLRAQSRRSARRHALTLEVDDFGNVLRVGRGRLRPPAARRRSAADARDQREADASCSSPTRENAFTNADRRAPTTTARRCRAKSRTYELTGLAPDGTRQRFTLRRLDQADGRRCRGRSDDSLRAERRRDGVLQKRLIEHVRTLYRTRRSDRRALAARRSWNRCALPFESYKLAFTPGLVAQVYGGAR